MLVTSHMPPLGLRRVSFCVAKHASIGTPSFEATMSIAPFTVVAFAPVTAYRSKIDFTEENTNLLLRCM